MCDQTIPFGSGLFQIRANLAEKMIGNWLTTSPWGSPAIERPDKTTRLEDTA